MTSHVPLVYTQAHRNRGFEFKCYVILLVDIASSGL